SVEELLRPQGDGAALRLEGKTFTRRLFCPTCRMGRAYLHVTERLELSQCICAECGQAPTVRGFDQVDWLPAPGLTAKDLGQSLAQLGLRSGDVLTVRSARGESHHEIKGRSGNHVQ